MTASAAASSPASGTHAATWPGLCPGVATTSTVRPPSSRRASAGTASVPANGGPARSRRARRPPRRTARRRARRSARSARGSMRSGSPTSGRSSAPASTRAPGLAASSSAVPPRWSLSGCVMSTIELALAEALDERQQLVAGRRPAGPCRRPAPPRRRRSRPARTMRGPSSCSQLQMPVGELVDHADASRASSRPPTTAALSPAPADDVQRARPAETREVGQVERLERGERKRHRRDRAGSRRAAPRGSRRRARSAAPAMRSSSDGCEQGDQPERLRAPDRDAPRVDLLPGRVALGEPLDERERRRRRGSRGGRGRASRPPSRARTRRLRSRPCRAGPERARPSRARVRSRRPPMRARPPCRARRARSARRESSSVHSDGSRKHRVERHARRDVEREPLAEALARARRGS